MLMASAGGAGAATAAAATAAAARSADLRLTTGEGVEGEGLPAGGAPIVTQRPTRWASRQAPRGRPTPAAQNAVKGGMVEYVATETAEQVRGGALFVRPVHVDANGDAKVEQPQQCRLERHVLADTRDSADAAVVSGRVDVVVEHLDRHNERGEHQPVNVHRADGQRRRCRGEAVEVNKSGHVGGTGAAGVGDQPAHIVEKRKRLAGRGKELGQRVVRGGGRAAARRPCVGVHPPVEDSCDGCGKRLIREARQAIVLVRGGGTPLP